MADARAHPYVISIAIQKTNLTRGRSGGRSTAEPRYRLNIHTMYFTETVTVRGIEMTVTGEYTIDRCDRDTAQHYECNIESVTVEGIDITDLLSDRTLTDIEEKISEKQ